MGVKPVSSVGTTESDRLLSVLKAARQKAGLTQRALSAKLGHSPTYIGKVERGIRRLDMVEFFEFAAALGEDPRELFSRIADAVAPA